MCSAVSGSGDIFVFSGGSSHSTHFFTGFLFVQHSFSGLLWSDSLVWGEDRCCGCCWCKPRPLRCCRDLSTSYDQVRSDTLGSIAQEAFATKRWVKLVTCVWWKWTTLRGAAQCPEGSESAADGGGVWHVHRCGGGATGLQHTSPTDWWTSSFRTKKRL